MRRHLVASAAVVLLAACGEGSSGFRGPTAPAVPVATTLTITTRNVLLFADSSLQLVAEVTDGRGGIVPGRIAWHSSNQAVVHVDTLGVATARYAGTVTVIASTGGLSDSTIIVAQGPAGALPVSTPR